MKRHFRITVCLTLHWLLPSYGDGAMEDDIMWLQEAARSFPSQMTIADADNWDGAELRRFLDGASLEQLVDAIERMPPPQFGRMRFVSIKSAVIATLRETHVSGTEKVEAYSRLTAVLASWEDLGRKKEDIALLEFAGSLSSSIILFRCLDHANDSLRFFATNSLARGIYVDLDAVQFLSVPLPKDILTDLVKSLIPVELTCAKGYDSSYLWRPQLAGQLAGKREQDEPVRAFFFVRGDSKQLAFLLLADSAGLLVPVYGTTNVIFVLGTEESNKALNSAANFVKGAESHPVK